MIELLFIAILGLAFGYVNSRMMRVTIDILLTGVFVLIIWWIVSSAIMTPTERAALHELHARLSAEHPDLRCKITILTPDGNIVTCTDGHGNFLIKEKP